MLSVIPFPLLSRRLILFLSGIWNPVPERGERKLRLDDVHEVPLLAKGSSYPIFEAVPNSPVFLVHIYP